MATKRRRKPATSTARQSARGRSTWVVFLAGLIVGACGAVVAQNSNLGSRMLAWVQPGSGGAESERTGNVAGKSGPAESKPRFQFYTLLPEMEVAVPEDELKPAATKTPPKPAPVPKPVVETAKPKQAPNTATTVPTAATAPKQAASKSSYVLQLGSFSSPGDAERLKANLALLGVQAHIQRVQINDADTFHRVRAGPYGSLDEVNEARSSLRSNNIDSMVYKVKR